MTHLFREGEILLGKYRVERVLGQGGMGIVVAARHVQLEERVAIKLMLANPVNVEAAARFVREARASARLESAHVARVSDVGTLDDGRAYMVMEYLDGCDLAQLLAANGPLPVGDAVDYVLQAGEAIAEAHSLGIVHRDLKPSNLFLTRRRDRTPHIKVLDFGISKISGPATPGVDNAMTKTSALMGSPLYMSPEQMTSVRDVDGRSDIWSLGVVLYELLAGTLPFVGDTLPQVCGLVLQAPAPFVRDRRSDVPVEVDAVIQRCLAKSPADRYQSIAELAHAMRELAGPYGRASLDRILLLAGGEASIPPQPPTHLSQPPSFGHGTHAAWGDTKPPAPRRSALWLLPLATVPLLAALGWWALVGHSVTSPRPDSSAATVSGTQLAQSAPTPDAISAPTVTVSQAVVPLPSASVDVVQTPLPAMKNTYKPSGANPQAKPATSNAPVQMATPTPKGEPKKPVGMGGRL